MIFLCKKCGKPFETDDVTDFFCEKHRNEKSVDPNENLYAKVRAAMKEGVSYGQYQGGKKRH